MDELAELGVGPCVFLDDIDAVQHQQRGFLLAHDIADDREQSGQTLALERTVGADIG
jgi:hypothetical protein